MPLMVTVELGSEQASFTLPPVLSITELAALSGKSTHSIHHRIRDGRLPHAEKIGGRWCIPARDVTDPRADLGFSDR